MTNIELIENEIQISAEENDKSYFQFHKKRFERFDGFLAKHFPPTKDINSRKVLEIGSHYLHSSMVLSLRKFEVDAMDVMEFWDLSFVSRRAEKYGLNPIVENNLSGLDQFQGITNKYDLIVFTEIMEHITFNPIHFWKTVYQLLRPGGMIYISTPNAFSLPNYFRNLKNMLLFKSIGITVDDIFSKVTYGHHWKEYSAGEIKAYFRLLSDDFKLEVNPYHYKNYDLKPPYLLFKLLSKLGNTIKLFSDDLEIIVKVPQKTKWKAKLPNY